ncbi:alpha-galactosidase [Aureibaculum marinum]|uniref:Alpha-galactosidase n=1 Tax=Aureibaculum marinum TaxID=2487930 RepID=A0A3N4NQE3_9FLAO|nr:alpha-galactosidase [Aureibaculum marinum]RPD98501.1 alpha-galactosidase [Aureibaculum marinum]
MKPLLKITALIGVVFILSFTAIINKTNDWLIDNTVYEAQVFNKGKDVVLTNGLITRKIRMTPNAATVEFKNDVTGETMLRSIKPEAEVTIDGITYAVGGLTGLKEHGYLKNEWIDNLEADENAFQFKDYTDKPIDRKIKWSKNKEFNLATKAYATGREIVLEFRHKSPHLKKIKVFVHYEIYNGAPLISKWITIENNSSKSIKINGFKNEILAFPEPENPVDKPEQWMRPNIHVESDYAFGGFSASSANHTIFYEKDPEYTSQVNYNLEIPCLLESKLQVGPDRILQPNESFESFHTYELLLDGTDRERNSLSKRKMYRLLAPWTTENPIFMHLTSTDSTEVVSAIDQCKETGYEMVILSFGSGLNMEDTTAVNIRKFKNLTDYAHSKGIKLGGYSLFSSRKISNEVDVIDKNTGQPGGAKFGNAPCLATEWGHSYLEKLKYFIDQTGFDVLEHDGPYPGDFCASTTHKYHKGYEDSQWEQWKMITDFYHWLKEKRIYLNAPDFYYLKGSNKCGIGYREVNWSLPREQQIILGRQNIYDGTWDKTPSMGWIFVPLTEYHGGGKEATIEPLNKHLDSYEAHMVQNYGAGVQAAYRGVRLYDTEKTKELVVDQINHYKKYREILNSDIIHIRRPNGRSWDGFMHANPNISEKGFLMLFNPTNTTIDEVIKVPLYYTGITEEAIISEKGKKKGKKYQLNRKYEVELEVKIPANSYTWFVIK